MNNITLHHKSDWNTVLAWLPADMEHTAEKYKAFQRARAIHSPQDLLRMLLAYALADYSLRDVVAWARNQGIAEISDVAFLHRAQKADTWLAHLLQQLLERRKIALNTEPKPYRLRIVDGNGTPE